jgi:hypothetical protein
VFSFKLVPPLENYESLAILTQTMSLISDSEDGPDHEFYDIDAVGDIDSSSASPKFFKWDRWSLEEKSYQFKTLKFDEENVPAGDSISYCLGIQEAPDARKRDYDDQN